MHFASAAFLICVLVRKIWFLTWSLQRRYAFFLALVCMLSHTLSNTRHQTTLIIIRRTAWQGIPSFWRWPAWFPTKRSACRHQTTLIICPKAWSLAAASNIQQKAELLTCCAKQHIETHPVSLQLSTKKIANRSIANFRPPTAQFTLASYLRKN